METTMVPPAASIPPPSPLIFEIPRPERQSRLTNFPLGIGMFIRVILAIPHFFILSFLLLASGVTGFLADFVILFTGKYPLGLFNFAVGANRWAVNVIAYITHLRDEYPPFSMDAGQYPVTFDVAYPENLNRFLNFPIFGIYIKGLLLIPHMIVLYALLFVASLLLFIAPFAILFTGSFPSGMHGFVVGLVRWWSRVNIYGLSLTDDYPPFSLK